MQIIRLSGNPNKNLSLSSVARPRVLGFLQWDLVWVFRAGLPLSSRRVPLVKVRTSKVPKEALVVRSVIIIFIRYYLSYLTVSFFVPTLHPPCAITFFDFCFGFLYLGFVEKKLEIYLSGWTSHT